MADRELCPEGCGCRKGTDDADSADCACPGPCTMAEDWGPDREWDPELYGEEVD